MNAADASSETEQSGISIASVPQANHENLSQTISGHTKPDSSISEANLIEHPLKSITYKMERKRPLNCQCDPDVAKIIDPEVGKAQLTKLEQLQARYETESQGPRKETSMLIALRNHVNKCLKISSASSSTSNRTPLSTSEIWKATVENKPEAQKFYGQSESPSLALAADLPSNEVLPSISHTPSSNSLKNDHPEYLGGHNETPRSHIIDLLVNHKSSKNRSLPGHIHCSTIFKATGEFMDNSADRATSLEESMASGYLASLGDLKSMPEGQLDWNKVAELERALWKVNEDPQTRIFVRQSSLVTYLKVMEEAMSVCSVKCQKLMEEENKLSAEKQTYLSPEKLQRLAHLRLLMQDTSKQIEMFRKTLKKPDLFATNMTEEERALIKRWPLCTPIRCRERYARQVRVVTEMLTIMQELLERIQQQEDDGSQKLDSENQTGV